MADLTPLDEKLAEVLGLAQAAQRTTEKVKAMEGADEFAEQLDRMLEEAQETERRTDELVSTFDGKKTAIHEMARETKSSATEMAKTYLEGEDEALDGFEWLVMAEAGELGHWEIVRTMSQTAGADKVQALADWACDVQQRHFDTVRRASLELARAEAA